MQKHSYKAVESEMRLLFIIPFHPLRITLCRFLVLIFCGLIGIIIGFGFDMHYLFDVGNNLVDIHIGSVYKFCVVGLFERCDLAVRVVVVALYYVLQQRIVIDGLSFFNDLLISASCCLLYTTPSPRDKRQKRMPSSA